jgi:hypothetical protein
MSKPAAQLPTVEEIAEICHEANRVYCETRGDVSQVPWRQAPEWQRDSAVVGVSFNLTNPSAPPSASHESWLKQKLHDGWTFCPVKDPSLKTHPCIVPYEQLPADQRRKDSLFKAIVNALAI